MTCHSDWISFGQAGASAMKHINREFTEALSRRCQREAASVLSAMERGQHLNVWFDHQGPHWKLSGGRRVPDDVARLVVKSERIISVGDVLFENLTPQTYRHVGDGPPDRPTAPAAAAACRCCQDVAHGVEGTVEALPATLFVGRS